MDAGVFEQVTNVACLPGIQKYAYCMPDGHWGLFNNVQVLSTKTGFPSAAWRHLT
ncbi:MAG TPA: RtcB family protein [Candidatus Aenigmarchaeota archaeon]|nr:RtcB family protein [Candidatus Aenigmarchaeota archaeon]